MPFVNIPRSKLVGGIAKTVGKLQGDIANKIVTQTRDITSNFRREGCPSSGKLARLRNQKQGLDQGISGAVNRINKFKALPNKLKGPLSGLKSALKVILAIPIPQAVPPGIGLPVNITTKFADVLHLIKEFIIQIGEDIDGIETVLETPNNFLSSIEKLAGRLDGALKACEAEAALRAQVEDGSISEEELKDLDIIDDDGTYIFSTLGPLFVGNISIDDNGNISSINESSFNENDDNGNISNIDGSGFDDNGNISNINGSGLNENDDNGNISNIDENGFDGNGNISNIGGSGFDGNGNISNINGSGFGGNGNITSINGSGFNENDDNDRLSKANKRLQNILKKIEFSNLPKSTKEELRKNLSLFQNLNAETQTTDSRFFHTGPTGIVYKLEILPDPESSSIAPRNFAIAREPGGAVVLKGPKSFSSSIDVLLDEIKFRIDNQLS